MPTLRQPPVRLALIAIALIAGNFCIASAPADPTTPDKIALAIAQLGDESFQVRERASKALWAIGAPAEAALKEAANGDNPEIAARAKEILADFEYGIYPETPPDVMALLRGYRRASPEEKRGVVERLVSRKAYGALVRLAALEQNKDAQGEILVELAEHAVEAAGALLVEGDTAMAEDLLGTGLSHNVDGAVRSYAAYLLSTGGIDQKIPGLRQQVEAGGGGVTQRRTLWALYRAKGDLAGALWAAEKSDDFELVDQVLIEQGQWKKVSQRYALRIGQDQDIEKLGLLAAFSRLAGDSAQFEKTIKRIELHGQDAGEEIGPSAVALLLNDRPEQAFELLKRSGKPAVMFQLLMAQQRWTEAIDLATKAIEAKDASAMQLRAMLVRCFGFLGDKRRGAQVLDGIAAELRAGDAGMYRQLIDMEVSAGLKDRAMADAAAILTKTPDEPAEGMILAELFPGRGAEAVAWWRLFRHENANEDLKSTLTRIDGLLEGTAGAAELDAFAASAEAAPAEVWRDRATAMRSVAHTLLAAGRDAAARHILEKLPLTDDAGDVAETAIERGNQAARDQQWQQAADYYGQAARADRASAVAQYLQGHALVKAGNQEQGQKLIDRALVLPLGNQAMRWALVDAMQQADDEPRRRQQVQFILHTADPGTWELGTAQRHAASEANQAGDLAAATDLWERSMLDCLRAGMSFVDESQYLGMPHLIHKTRALAFLAAGKPEDAMAQISLCEKYIPGDISLPIDLMGPLAAAGKGAEAEAMFAGVLEAQRKLVATYPDSAAMQNSLSWLLARCRRNLDEALKAGLRGVELHPRDCAIIDTLAEVYFQRGQNDKAIETIKRCIALEPNMPRHRAALKRFEKGDPQTPPPPE